MSQFPTVDSLIKKIHMYLGLLNLSILLVFGIAGLKATFHRPGEPSRTPLAPVYTDFTAPASVIDDKEMVEIIRRQLRIAAVGLNNKRDANQNLSVNYYTQNGPRTVTYLEKENRLRIVDNPAPMLNFIDNLHGTANRHPADWRVRLWSYYNEFSVWSLIAMAATGVYLWLCSRPAYRWAQLAFAAGSGAFLLLYFLSR